jgi:hypothetical protein
LASTTGITNWSDLLNESVHTSDDEDIGDIEAVNRNFIVVKRGWSNVHRYYIPASKVDAWDGSVLWLNVPEQTVKSNYERNTVPDTGRYMVKGHEDEYKGDYPEIRTSPVRYALPTYPTTSTEELSIYRCPLCETQSASTSMTTTTTPAFRNE